MRRLTRPPPELASDIARDGVTLAGGGMLLDGMDELLSDELGTPAALAQSPLTCVAIGSGLALDNYDALRSRHPRAGLQTSPDWRTAM